MDKCVDKVFNNQFLLVSSDLNDKEKKDNLKSIIYSHIFNNTLSEDTSLKKILTSLKDERDYCNDLLEALVLGMGIIQNSSIDLIKMRGRDKITEPIYSYSKDGVLVSITFLSSASRYKTLLQVSRYFDDRFLINNHVRTLHK